MICIAIYQKEVLHPAYLAAGGHVNFVDAAEHGRRQFGPERIPDSVLQLAALLLHSDALLAVYRLQRGIVHLH